MVMNVTSRCSRAGAEALRQGAQLAADARDTFRAGALLLRGSPFAVGWVAGWLSTEFPPHVVTGHALSRSSRPSIGRVGTTWAAQRADQALTAALEESFGPDFRELVCHPTAGSIHVRPPQWSVAQARAAPAVRGTDLRHLLRPGRTRQPARHLATPRLGARVAGAGADPGPRRRVGRRRPTGAGLHADEPHGRTRLDLRIDQLQQEPALRISDATSST